MSIDDFFIAITAVFPDVPIFFEEIDVEEGDELPPNYIYFESGTTIALAADNITYYSVTPIELLVVQTNPIANDDTLTAQVEEFLDTNRLIYTKQVGADSDIRATVTTYTFTI